MVLRRFEKWCGGVAVAGSVLLELCARADVAVLLPYVRNGGTHPMIQGGFNQNHWLARARLASPEVWQHLLAEMPHYAWLLGLHDGRKVQSVPKIWTLLTAS